MPQVWGTAAVVGVSLVGSFMGSRAKKKEAQAARERGRAIRKLEYAKAEMVEQGAHRALKISGQNVRMAEIEAEDAAYKAAFNVTTLKNFSKQLVDDASAMMSDIASEATRQLSKIEANFAANGMALDSVSAQGTLNDQRIATNLELARVGNDLSKEQLNIIQETSNIQYEAKRNAGKQILGVLFEQDAAQYGFKSTMTEAKFMRQAGDIGLQSAESQASAIRAQGTADLISGVANAGISTIGSSEFRSDFNTKFSSKKTT